MTNFDAKTIDALVEKYTVKYTSDSKDISRAYKYALFGGGKRMRPLLMLNTAAAMGKIDGNIERLVVAMECLHTYSLVHDDLPCMDNDDFRRGKPTVHRVFGDAVGVLCGDGLLTMSMQILTEGKSSPQYFSSIARLYNSAQKMVYGQAEDLKANVFIDDNRYFDIVDQKTGGVLTDCICIPAVYFKRLDTLSLLEDIGGKIGKLYQITDDILDEKKAETSILNIMSDTQARALLRRLTVEVERQIDEYSSIENVNMQYLKDFVEFNVTRKV